MKKILKIFLGIIAVIALHIAVSAIIIVVYGNMDFKKHSDVIIVLGASTYNDTVSPVYKERLNHGISLYKEGYADKMILTGGMGAGNDKSDAEVAKEYAISQGVDEEDIFIETTSKITLENLLNAKKIMKAEGFETAIIVSDPLHMKRAMLIAKIEGIKAYSSPTPTTLYRGNKAKFDFMVREVPCYIYYTWYWIISGIIGLFT